MNKPREAQTELEQAVPVIRSIVALVIYLRQNSGEGPSSGSANSRRVAAAYEVADEFMSHFRADTHMDGE